MNEPVTADVGSPERWHQLSADLGVPLTDDQIEALQRYGRWLADEAAAAGGIGPREPARLFDRHLADAVTVLAAIPAESRTLLDVGTGVGLPGIPIAIARPTLAVTLLDQSERRTWLARRACRILDLDLTVQRSPVDRIDTPYDVLAFRASLTVDSAAGLVVSGRYGPTTGVFALSRAEAPPDIPELAGVTTELVDVRSTVLDSPSWLLRMRTADPSTPQNQE